jgi:hypothetical protein
MIPMIFLLVLLIPILAIVLDSPVGRALAGRMERLAYLEVEVERLTTELVRLEEESQFLNKLLTKQPASQVLPPGDQNR